MSTFLVSVGVVAAATAIVIGIALSDPDQPATIRRDTGRARSPRQRPPTFTFPAHPAPGNREVVAVVAPAPTLARGRRAPARRRQAAGVRLRVRSGLALVILVAFTGVLLAVMIGAGLALAAQALRHAVGS